jgi:hypothetical protein
MPARHATIYLSLAAAAATALALDTGEPVVGRASRFAASLAVRDLPKDERPVISHKLARDGEEPRAPREIRNFFLDRSAPGAKPDRDAALQGAATAPERGAPALGGVQFDGLSSADNVAVFGGAVYPPDTNHDVGPNHIVETTNLLVRVYDKSGAALTSPFRMSTLFAPLGGLCSTHDDGDPIVLYDPLADRWLLSQFTYEGTAANRECVAISQTPDPTGAYYLYEFPSPIAAFQDYPHLGVWPDGYYMTTNQFNTSLTAFIGGGVFAYERDKMLVGDPTARQIYFDLGAVDPNIGGMLPSDFDGLIAPPAGTPNPFVYFTATEFGDASDALRVFDFAADWTAPERSTFTERAESPIAAAAFNPLTPSGRNDILQNGGTCSNALDTIGDRVMHRVAYRNLGDGHEILVLNHTVNANGVTSCSTGASTYQAGVRLYELRRTTGAANPFAISQQVTFAPDGTSRWMASAASDHQGNLAVAYSAASKTVYASLRYTGRLAGDTANTLQNEATMHAGTGAQTGTGARWGDYSMLAVDPADDCTFWYSQEYYSTTAAVDWKTRIGNFKFSGCTTSPRGALETTVTNCSGGAPIAGATVTAGSYVRTTNGSGVALISPAAPGGYTVTASRVGSASDSDSVVVTNGNTTQLSLCLTGVPQLVADGASLETEGCSGGNGVIDPGETVSVSLCVENNGLASTTNLVGTLVAIDGVVLPGPAQSFGALASGGGSGCRPFSFTADPTLSCGDDVVVHLHLEDGATDLGTLEFNLGPSGGGFTDVFSQSFDGVTPPALPAGWTQSNATGTDPTVWSSSASGTPSPVAVSAPNSARINDPAGINDKRLESPAIPITASNPQLRFQNNYDLENGYDGGVLEVSINGGAFADLLTAGGSFLENGYNKTISTGFSSPIGGRSAWSDTSSGFVETVAVLPVAAGQSVKLRFRMGSDSSVSDQGWRIDDVRVQELVCCPSNVIFVADHEEADTSEWTTTVPAP